MLIVIDVPSRQAPRTLKRFFNPLNQKQAVAILNQTTRADNKLAIVDSRTLGANGAFPSVYLA